MILRVLWTALAVVTLSACGGGGGGGGGGNLTLDRSSLGFQADQGQAAPPAQVIRVTVADSRAAFVGVAYGPGTSPPAWLGIDLIQNGLAYDAVFTVIPADLAPGSYTAMPSIGYTDASGTVLGSREVAISLTVRARLSASETPLNADLVFGSSNDRQALGIAVTADTLGWRVSADAPWIVLPAGPFNGSQLLPVTLDGSSLSIGSYRGAVTLTSNADAGNTVTVPVFLNVAAPTLTASPAGMQFGGADGLAATPPQALRFQLDTGSNGYPWTMNLSNGSAPASWVSASAVSGTVDAAGAVSEIGANPAVLVGGSYIGSARIEVDVRGQRLSYTLPIQLDKEVERLKVATDGVAFSQLPSYELLSRDIRVGTSLGRAGVPWTASSSAGWLNVTASGVTGEALRITVTPGVLATDTAHTASVTVIGSDPGIGTGDPAVETIEISFWRSGVDPGRLEFAGEGLRTAANPVLPLVYSHVGSDQISVRNVYTGERVAVFPAGTRRPGAMAVSSSGDVLYVVDHEANQLVALDARSGASITRYPYSGTGYLGSAELVYVRPSAVPTLIVGNGDVVDLASGELLPNAFMASGIYSAGTIAASADGHDVYVHNVGTSPSTIGHSQLSWSTFNGRRLVARDLGSVSPGSNGQDVAVSPDGSRLFSASGAPYAFPVFDGVTLAPIGSLAGAAYPNNVETAWNGLLVGGADATYDPVDLWFYRQDGTAVGTRRCVTGNVSLVAASVRFSGDAFRYVCAATGIDAGDGRALVIDNVPRP